MEEKRIRSARLSKEQKEYLVSYLEQNGLLESKINPSDKFKNKWNEVTKHLNSLQGAKKTVSQWKDVILVEVPTEKPTPKKKVA
ncbi:hypothetical protein NQ314_015819 [Rhamnusium bicolor]|uniref:Regulatory protein zeste n=1 Tax=Rhamnusium bicolor TaxID=1586634 RepID=A0AAV8WYJ3_9CUCU|nr:hypothetical protein NQ314_015819 [Rhamnusium bicolor]